MGQADKEVSKQVGEQVSEQVDEEASQEVSEQVSKQVGEGVSQEASKQVSQEVSEGASKEVSEEVSKQVGQEASKQVSEQVSEQAGSQVSKGVSNQEVKEIYQEVIKEIKAEVYSETQNYFERLIHSLEANLNDHLGSLTENISASLAMLNENQLALHKAITGVNERVVSMEAEFGLDSAEEIEIGSLKTGDLKINVEELALDLPLMGDRGEDEETTQEEEAPLPDTSLDNVLKSITNGVSDKVAVVQWLCAMRSQTPCPTYAELAARLDNAGVPTLSGRAGWNRGSLSKMVTEGTGANVVVEDTEIN